MVVEYERFLVTLPPADHDCDAIYTDRRAWSGGHTNDGHVSGIRRYLALWDLAGGEIRLGHAARFCITDRSHLLSDLCLPRFFS